METPVHVTTNTQYGSSIEFFHEPQVAPVQARSEQQFTSSGLPIGPCGLVEGQAYWNLRNHQAADVARSAVGFSFELER